MLAHYWRLHEEVEKCSIDGVRALLLRHPKLDINSEDAAFLADGNSPLHVGVFQRRNDFVQYLLSINADVNLKATSGYTAMQCALNVSFKKDLDLLKLFIDAGTNVDSVNNLEQTALRILCNRDCKISQNDEISWVEYLLSKGANVRLKTRDGWSAIHFASKWPKDNLALLKILVAAGGQVHDRTEQGLTALHIAAGCKNLAVIEYLLSLGVHVNELDVLRQTPLHKACAPYVRANNSLGAIKCLLKNGAKMSAVDEKGLTPLMVSLIRPEINTDWEVSLKFLIKYSDINVADSDGKDILVKPDDRSSVKKKVCKIIIDHVTKLKALNCFIHPNILKTISNNSDHEYYFTRRQDELLLAKQTKLKNLSVTHMDLLAANKTKLLKYAESKDLIDGFNWSVCLYKFPIYGPEMCKNLEKVLKRRKFYDKSALHLSNYWPIFNPKSEIITSILKVLNIKDLERLSRGMSKRSRTM